jgi:hypothetical protein
MRKCTEWLCKFVRFPTARNAAWIKQTDKQKKNNCYRVVFFSSHVFIEFFTSSAKA